MRTAGKSRAIRSAFFHPGLHTTPQGVVGALRGQGIQVDEECVRQVWFELLKENTGAKSATVARPVPSPAVPEGVPVHGSRCRCS
jgi:hypothetical protein